MTFSPQHPLSPRRIIQFIKTSGQTNSREEKDILVSKLTVNESETALLTFMSDNTHLTLLSTLRKIYTHCIDNEAPHDADIIISDRILFNIFQKSTFHTNQIKPMLLNKVTITKSNDPEHLLDFRLYKMTGLPILTTTLQHTLQQHPVQPLQQGLGPTSSLQAFYTDDSENSEEPPPLEGSSNTTTETSTDTGDDSETLDTTSGSNKQNSNNSSSNPDPPKHTISIQPQPSSGADDEYTITGEPQTQTTRLTKCIICSQKSIHQLPYCHPCWQNLKSRRPPHKRNYKIPLIHDEQLTTTLPTCIICNTKPSNSAFVHGNTGHVTACYKCSRRIIKQCKNKCPICNNRTSSIIKLFM